MNDTVNQETTPTTEQTERTFTQAEVNQIVADRIARERNKYADYDALKAKADQFDTAQKQLSELNKANELRARVSTATGVPAHLLTGDTEEACTAQAQEILKFSRPAYPVVKDGGEPLHPPRGNDELASAFSRNKKHKPKDFKSY